MSDVMKALNQDLIRHDLDAALPRVVDVLAGGSAAGLGVREARDRFTQLLRDARAGQAQVVGSEEDGQVFIVSAREVTGLLAEVIETRSFVEAVCSGPGFDQQPDTLLQFEERPRSSEAFLPGGALPAMSRAERGTDGEAAAPYRRR